ncbi:hypothetical protein LJR129_005038 [Acidovorax sp. LjRoot129]|uniref:hypothetical protein n=1 Tax=unclassified Acidovorax TaxID=2684926 RepID=UPI003ECDC968
MINELEHIKLGFSELPVVDSSSTWLKYHFDNAGAATVTFAKETTHGGEPQWRRIDGTWGLCGRSLYGDFKKGAAWEIHSEQRLLRGKKVLVEAYLAALHKLPVRQSSELGHFRAVAHKRLDENGMAYIDSYYGHDWDKSQWKVFKDGDSVAFEIPITTRENLTFLSQVSGPSEFYLVKTGAPVEIGAACSNLELFA